MYNWDTERIIVLAKQHSFIHSFTHPVTIK